MADVLEPLNSIHMNFQLLFKSQTNSYNVAVLNYTFEVCKSMNDFPPPMKFVLPVINMFAKNLIHPCPYVGKSHINFIYLFESFYIFSKIKYLGREIGVKNFPLETAFQPVVSFVNLESGNYRLDVTFWNKNWEVLYWLKMYAEVGSKSIQRKHNRN